MKNLAVVLGTILAIFPSLSYLADLRYRFDPALQRSVCRNLACSDTLLLEAADRFADGNGEDKAIALANLQEAMLRNVASPYRWCDLGQAFLNADRIEEARYCFTRAVELGRRSPPVLWRAALFFNEIQELHQSQEYLGKMLDLAPGYKELVFGMYLANPKGVLDTLDFGISRQGGVPQDYFRYLLANGTREDVKKTWDWLLEHALADNRVAGDYVDYLAKRADYSLAAEIWKRSAGRYDDAYLKPNLVFNGGFESEPLQSGLDWRFFEIQGVRIRHDSNVALSGSASLRIEFDGKQNVDFNSVTHDVVANPGRYYFKGWVRTSALTTDQGIAFRLADSLGQIRLQTTPLTGTRDWTPVELDFTLSAPVRLLRIEVIRQPSSKFDNKIAGQVWIDDVYLVRR